MPTGRYYEGATMTIINRSEVLGLPLTVMLSRMAGATVHSVDVNSVLLFRPDGGVRRVGASSSAAVERCVGMSSVIVSGVPSSSPENATAINVAAGRSNFDEGTLLSGDDASRRRGVTYIPHVGRVTVAALEYNLMSLHKKYNST
jgi:methylenetetrahydrofolate dehydrogenase (NAD+)